MSNVVIGAVFGRLTVVEKTSDQCLVSCECGASKTVAAHNLKAGRTRSCGCLNKEAASARSRKHGMSESPEFSVWLSMIGRCSNQNSQDWPMYGGRGIRVCERWASFEAFYADMGPRPRGMSIDRVDTNGNYEPGNCRWATPKEQARNTRRNRIIVVRGVARLLVEWSQITGLSQSLIHKRISNGMSAEDAVLTPVRQKRPKEVG